MRINDHQLVYLSPIAPSPTGNGLAMRGSLFVAGASRDFDVKVVVVPVAGETDTPACGREVACSTVAVGARSRAEIGGLLGDPLWRARITQAYPLPAMARLAPATLAGEVAAAAGVAPGTPVHVARSYLAPLGVAVGERLASRWMSLDLDDDDEAVASALGDDGEADRHGRLIRVFGRLFQAVALAAEGEANAVSRRHGIATQVVPNAVRLPTVCARDRQNPGVSVLFVGNLTYRPNVDAALVLVDAVLPVLRTMVAAPVEVTLVGDYGSDQRLRALAHHGGVRVAGFVPDVSPFYDAADLVVAPIAAGGGTRIKLLEAFAHAIPVVTTTAGVAGLQAHHGEHLLIADSPARIAEQAARLIVDLELRSRLVAGAARLVRDRYSVEAVIPLTREFFATAAGR